MNKISRSNSFLSVVRFWFQTYNWCSTFHSSRRNFTCWIRAHVERVFRVNQIINCKLLANTRFQCSSRELLDFGVYVRTCYMQICTCVTYDYVLLRVNRRVCSWATVAWNCSGIEYSDQVLLHLAILFPMLFLHCRFQAWFTRCSLPIPRVSLFAILFHGR